MQRLITILMALGFAVGCGPASRNGDDTPFTPDACEGGLRCQIVNCAAQGKPPTSISGKAYAPNRTLPLYGVSVYIPNADPGPFETGASCGRCQEQLPGEPLASATSDEEGKFTLSDVPAGSNVPLIITIGKWRTRQFIPEIKACEDNELPPELTSLPRSHLEGDMPKIAIATGSCDALECLIKKIGVDITEFTPDTGPGNIHLYASNGANKNTSGQTFSSATNLWGNLEQLKKYDIALFSCECGQTPGNKPQEAMNAIKAYADLGGRVFLSHFHNIWISGEEGMPAHAPQVWPQIASCQEDLYGTGNDTIDTVNNPKGTPFATWMSKVGGSPSPGVIPIEEGRQTCTTIDNTKAERWVYYKTNGIEYPQNFQFTTPNEIDKDQRCGKVVFSDMHVASGSTSSSGTAFPGGCSSSEMTPQEKALAFMFFDISSCLGPIF